MTLAGVEGKRLKLQICCHPQTGQAQWTREGGGHSAALESRGSGAEMHCTESDLSVANVLHLWVPQFYAA